MCIEQDSLKEIKPGSKSSSGFGWKEFGFERGEIFGELYCISTPRKVGVWYRYKSGPGFHIFTSLNSAKHWSRGDICDCNVLAKVEYQEAHTKGLQYHCNQGRTHFLPVIVANKMRIVGLYHLDGKPFTEKELKSIRKKNRA